jgi:hypothetical protein
MFIAVLGVLDSFKTVWQAVVAFASARAALDTAIDAIRDEELKQSGTTTGITENKRAARQAMCSAAAMVGGAVAAWAETQGKNDIFDTVDLSSSDLLHQTEADCLTHCNAIYNAANANLAALTAAGTLAAADLTDFNSKIGAFDALIAAPRLAKTGTSAATNLLPDKIDAGDRICERQLDKLMERYKDSNPDFYGAYQVARIIVDTGGGSGTPPTPPATPATPHP